MLAKFSRFTTLAALGLMAASTVFAQVGSLEGVVTDGEKPVRGAMIKIERQDIQGSYEVKTKKKGRWFHAGLPLGEYIVALEIDGKEVDRVVGVRVGVNDGPPVNFDLAEIRARTQTPAPGSQPPPEEVLRGMSPEQRKEYEEQLKERQQQISKNKELNEAFNLAMSAKQAGDYATAIDNFKKAIEIDPEQDVLFAQLAESQVNLAKSKTGDEREALYSDAVAAYDKAIALKPQNAAYYNNKGLAQVSAGDIEGGKQALNQAAEMDPVNGGKFFFNLGAVLTNTGRMDEAIAAFKRATEVQPDYAPAYYQLGTSLVGKAEVKADGSVEPVPGTIEAFQKYLELEPNGPYAPSAQSMIANLSGEVETSFEQKK